MVPRHRPHFKVHWLRYWHLGEVHILWCIADGMLTDFLVRLFAGSVLLCHFMWDHLSGTNPYGGSLDGFLTGVQDSWVLSSVRWWVLAPRPPSYSRGHTSSYVIARGP